MSVAGTTTARVVDQKAFRDVVGRFASGVTVITTSVDGQPFRDDRQRHVVPVDGSAAAAGLPEQDRRNGRGRAQGRNRFRSTSWPTPRSIWPASSRSRVRTSSPASLCTPD